MPNSANKKSNVKPAGHWIIQKRWLESTTNGSLHTPYTAYKAPKDKPTKKTEKEWVAKCIFGEDEIKVITENANDRLLEAKNREVRAKQKIAEAEIHIRTLTNQIGQLDSAEIIAERRITASQEKKRRELKNKIAEYEKSQRIAKNNLSEANRVIAASKTKEYLQLMIDEEFKIRKRLAIIEVIQQEIFRLYLGGKQPKTRYYIDEKKQIWVLSERVLSKPLPKSNPDRAAIKKLGQDLSNINVEDDKGFTLEKKFAKEWKQFKKIREEMTEYDSLAKNNPQRQINSVPMFGSSAQEELRLDREYLRVKADNRALQERFSTKWDQRKKILKRIAKKESQPNDQSLLQTIDRQMGTANIAIFEYIDQLERRINQKELEQKIGAENIAVLEEIDLINAKIAKIYDDDAEDMQDRKKSFLGPINEGRVTRFAEIGLIAGKTLEMDLQLGNIVVASGRRREQAVKIDGGLSFGPLNVDVVVSSAMKDLKKPKRKFVVKTSDLTDFFNGPKFYAPALWFDRYRYKWHDETIDGEQKRILDQEENRDEIKLFTEKYQKSARYLFDFHHGLLKINVLPPEMLKALVEFISDDEELNAHLIPLLLDIDKQYKAASKNIASYQGYLAGNTALQQFQEFRQHLESFHPMGKISLVQLTYSPNDATPTGLEQAQSIATQELNKNFYKIRFNFFKRNWSGLFAGGLLGGSVAFLACKLTFLAALTVWPIAAIVGATTIVAALTFAVLQNTQPISDEKLKLLPSNTTVSKSATQNIPSMLAEHSPSSLNNSSASTPGSAVSFGNNSVVLDSQAEKIKQNVASAQEEYSHKLDALLNDNPSLVSQPGQGLR